MMGDYVNMTAGKWRLCRIGFWAFVALLLFQAYMALASQLAPPLAFISGAVICIHAPYVVAYIKVERARSARLRAAFDALRKSEADQ